MYSQTQREVGNGPAYLFDYRIDQRRLLSVFTLQSVREEGGVDGGRRGEGKKDFSIDQRRLLSVITLQSVREDWGKDGKGR
jgi:hypothetical protein